MKKILINRIRCNHCGDIIESADPYDFRTCKCGRVSIGGGHKHEERSFVEIGDFTNLSVYEYDNGEVKGEPYSMMIDVEKCAYCKNSPVIISQALASKKHALSCPMCHIATEFSEGIKKCTDEWNSFMKQTSLKFELCPFCRGECELKVNNSENATSFWYECQKCHAGTASFPTPEEARKAWNRRDRP